MVNITILWLMILCHIIDDFVLQPVCLSNLKQKGWWQKQLTEKLDSTIYQYDYVVALFIHGLSWSIMILLPMMFLVDVNGVVLSEVILVNAILHAVIDHMKANLKIINLVVDQTLHMFQIVLTFLILCSC